MNWRGKKETSEVEDRTGQDSTNSSLGGLGDVLGGVLGSGGSSSGTSSGSLGGIKLGGGIGGILIALVVMFFMNGGSIGSTIGDVLGGGLTGGSLPQLSQQAPSTMGTSSDERKDFSKTIFQMLEDYWGPTMQDQGINYNQPTLVLYTGSTRTPFGVASADMGPFYSPGDEKVYLDTSFQDDLANQFGAKGDYVMAYVLAHEFGHHIQNELGLSDAMDKVRRSMSEPDYNRYSVALELQADYLAGVWTKWLETQTNSGKPVLEVGDVKEAMNAAASIGDDKIMSQAGMQVNESAFTHGSSADREKYFNLGYQTGDMSKMDVFKDKGLRDPRDW